MSDLAVEVAILVVPIILSLMKSPESEDKSSSNARTVALFFSRRTASASLHFAALVASACRAGACVVHDWFWWAVGYLSLVGLFTAKCEIEMSRKSSVYKHFEADEDGFICSVPECGQKITESNPEVPRNACSNLKRHLKRVHHDVYLEVEKEDGESSRKKTCRQQFLASPSQKITNFFASKVIQVHMTAEQFKLNIIDLVAGGGTPLSFFASDGMKGMIGEMAAKLGVSLDRSSVRDLVIGAAGAKRAEIREELRGVPVYIKIDSCTRHNRSFLGVNVQFTGPNGRAQVRTLAVRDCLGKHSGEETKILLQTVMADFGVSPQQLLAVVSDNAANMVKAVKLLNQDAGESQDGSDVEEDDDESEDEDEDPDPDGSDGMMDVSSISSTASHMRCAAHTLQLAVRDGIR